MSSIGSFGGMLCGALTARVGRHACQAVPYSRIVLTVRSHSADNALKFQSACFTRLSCQSLEAAQRVQLLQSISFSCKALCKALFLRRHRSTSTICSGTRKRFAYNSDIERPVLLGSLGHSLAVLPPASCCFEAPPSVPPRPVILGRLAVFLLVLSFWGAPPCDFGRCTLFSCVLSFWGAALCCPASCHFGAPRSVCPCLVDLGRRAPFPLVRSFWGAALCCPSPWRFGAPRSVPP